ncbi:MAG: cadmium-translocating P-type ATPase [Planctomycetes bacterium]|nr:cadmium-translocating P-type ATPase [Planctomycetota bacterium]
MGDAVCAVAALLLGAPIVLGALRNVARGTYDLHELIALSVAAAFALEDFVTAGVLALLATLGELVEHRTALGARAAIEGLVRLAPPRARVIGPDGAEEERDATDVRPGERVRVRPGDRVPVDGAVVEGASTLDEAAITGESVPAEKGVGAAVFAGTTNLTGALVVEATRAGDDTTLARVRALILAAEQARTPVTRLIDRLVRSYLPISLMLAAVVLFLTRDPTRVIALLVVAGPSALVLATPTAMVAALSAAARLGVLVKDPRDLELAAGLTRVVFDKTGTLTRGRLEARRLVLADDAGDPARVLALAAGAAAGSSHPAARAVVAVAAEAALVAPPAEDLREAPGLGVAARVDGHEVRLGRAALLEREGIAPRALDPALEAAGHTLLLIAIDGRHAATLALDDAARPQARAALAALTGQGVRVGMLTGDRRQAAARVAAEVGVEDVVSECLPEEKLEVVRRARAAGERVAVVGDGINDAPALAAAHLGIAMGGGGADVALASARVALLTDDLSRVPFLVALARRARATIAVNLAVAVATIVAGVTLAAAGAISPVVALVLHNAGDLAIVLNSARLVREGEELG